MTRLTEPVVGSTRGSLPLARVVLPGTAMIAVTFGLARYGYGLLLPEMSTDLQLDPGTAGYISSGAYVAYFLANLAVVVVVGRFGARMAILAAALTAAVGMALVASAGSAPLLAAGVVVGGAAAGFAFPPYADVVDTEVAAGRRDVAWSVISSGTGWGVALAGPVAIVAGGSWRWAWTAFVVVAVLVGAWAVRQSSGAGDGRRHRPQLSWTWFVCPKSRPLLLSAVLVGTSSAVWWSFSVDALRDAGLAATPARSFYAVCGAASLLASFSGAAFARTGLRAGYLGALVVLAASFVLLGRGSGVLVVALVAGVAFGAAYAGVVAAHGIWSARVFADHPAAGLAALNIALTIGTVLGPTLAGSVISAAGYPVVLLVAAGLLLCALPFCPPSTRRREVLAAHQCRARPARP